MSEGIFEGDILGMLTRRTVDADLLLPPQPYEPVRDAPMKRPLPSPHPISRRPALPQRKPSTRPIKPRSLPMRKPPMRRPPMPRRPMRKPPAMRPRQPVSPADRRPMPGPRRIMPPSMSRQKIAPPALPANVSVAPIGARMVDRSEPATTPSRIIETTAVPEKTVATPTTRTASTATAPTRTTTAAPTRTAMVKPALPKPAVPPKAPAPTPGKAGAKAAAASIPLVEEVKTAAKEMDRIPPAWIAMGGIFVLYLWLRK